jgi:hypothetical protein
MAHATIKTFKDGNGEPHVKQLVKDLATKTTQDTVDAYKRNAKLALSTDMETYCNVTANAAVNIGAFILGDVAGCMAAMTDKSPQAALDIYLGHIRHAVLNSPDFERSYQNLHNILKDG